MWKALIGFAIFAAVAMWIFIKSGADVNIGAEQHDVSAGAAHAPASAAAPAGPAASPAAAASR